MTTPVSDVKSNSKDNIAFAANVLKRAPQRMAVFSEIFRGKKRTKTATEIAKATKLPRKRVMEEAIKLHHDHIIPKPVRRDRDMHYTREDGFYYRHRAEIIKLAKNSRKLKDFPTKYSPRAVPSVVRVHIPTRRVSTETVTVDDIDSFSRVRQIKSANPTHGMREEAFKHGLQRIIGEKGKFKDWGGEKSDLYTTRLRFRRKRCAAAIALKGRATHGTLVPGKMGTNGDQIQRLFAEDAEVFLIQYGGQIASSVVDQMATHAKVKALYTETKVHYGVIDGQDSGRLVAAYPRAFRKR